MAQHDYILNDQNGANFRADLNSALSAIVSQNSGLLEPTTMVAYMMWADTTTNTLKQRNSTNTAWTVISNLNTSSVIVAAGKTLTVNNTLTLGGTDGTTMTFPTTSATLARTEAAQTFTGVQSFTSPDITTSITTGSTSFTAWSGATTLLTIGGTGASASLFAPSTLDTTSSTTGAIRTSGGISAAKAMWVGTDLTVNGGATIIGNLTVNGTTTTVNSTTVTIADPIFTLGGAAPPVSDDSKDRGIEFRWHNGSVAKVGFFGFDDSTGYLTFIPDATNTSEVFSGTIGDIEATNFRGALVGNATTATTLATTRAIYGNNFDGSAALTQIIASTYGGTGNGFTKFSGATTAEKTYTLPDAICTILTTNALVTSAQGGTGNGFTKFSGATTAEKTYTLPDATCTILTTNALVAVDQGGTGNSSYTNGQLLIGNTTGNTLTKATLTAGTNISITNGNGSIIINSAGASEAYADGIAVAMAIIFG